MLKRLMCVVMLVGGLSLVGCGGEEPPPPTNKRFEVLSDEIVRQGTTIVRVRDKKTKEEFIIFTGYNKGSIIKVDKLGE